MRDVVVIGSGGHAFETAWVVQCSGRQVVAFYDDDESRVGKRLFGLPVLGRVHLSAQMVIGIGAPKVRREIARRWPEVEDWIPPAIFPGASIGWGSELGIGSVVAPGVVITTGVELGAHCYVNVNAVIGHGVRAGDYVNLSQKASIAGDVVLGEGVHVGAGATVLQGLRLGFGCRIGAGAVVTKDVPPGETWVGVPARRMQML